MLLKFLDQRVQLNTQFLQCVQREFAHVPADSVMQQFMFLIGQQQQIFQAIVKLIAIAMMHVFVRMQRTAQMFLHYQSMFADALAVSCQIAVAMAKPALAAGVSQGMRICDTLRFVNNPLRMHRADGKQATFPAIALHADTLAAGDFAMWRQRIWLPTAKTRLEVRQFFYRQFVFLAPRSVFRTEPTICGSRVCAASDSACAFVH